MPRSLTTLGLLWVLALALTVRGGRPCTAAPPAPVAQKAPLPDYGGREGALGAALDNSGAAPPLNPLAQAGRALEALVIVLALIAGGLYGLKRLGVIKPDGQSARGAFPASRRLSNLKSGQGADPLIGLLGSQMLPNASGAGLHVVSVAGRTLLLGATAQSVTLLAELDPEDEDVSDTETDADKAAFADYLQKAGVTPPPAARSASAGDAFAGVTDRLPSLLARRRKEAQPE